MDGIIDADTHVLESEDVWRHFDREMYHRRPMAVIHEDPETGRSRSRWVIDGALVPKPDGKGGQALLTPPADPDEACSRSWRAKALLDVEARLEDADEMGVEVQVVFPTLFITHLTFDPALDVTLARAYNRFMADVWARGKGRVRWVAVMPFHDLGACITELGWARDRGAVGFMARGIEGERSLAEEYFFPSIRRPAD